MSSVLLGSVSRLYRVVYNFTNLWLVLSGAFKTSQPPDGFATGLNGLLNPKGAPSDMAYW